MVQSLNRCKACGLPRTLAENVEWLDNGTIALKNAGGMRMVILEKGLLEAVFKSLTGAAGEFALFEKEQGATRHVVGGVSSGLKGRLSRYAVIKRRILEGIEEYSPLLGMGRVEVERFTPSLGGSMVLRNPVNRMLVKAVIGGIIEQIERRHYRQHLEDIGEDAYRLVIEAAESDPYEESLYEPLPVAAPDSPGSCVRERCDQCGLPSGLGAYEWDELHGYIYSRSRGQRYTLLPWYTLALLSMPSMIREEKAEDYAEEAAYGHMLSALEEAEGGGPPGREGVRQDGEECLDRFLRDLPLHGWGLPGDRRNEGEGWRIRLSYPADSGIIAGCLGAIYTHTKGRRPSLSYREKVSDVIIKLD